MRLFEMRGQPRLRRLASRLCTSLGLLSVLVGLGSAQQLTTRAQLNAIIGVGAGCDNFETLVFGGVYQALTTATLNSSTVALAQTNLVQPGASYVSKLGNMAWLNNGFLGGPTKRIWANGSLGMDINYTSPVRAFGLDFYVATNVNGNITAKVHTVSSGTITLNFTFNAGQTPYFFGYADASGITKVEFFDNGGNAAVSIDDHCYGCPSNVWWCENFSPYPYGPFQGPAGGWHPWTPGSTTEFGIIQDNFCSPPKAMNVLSNTDMVHEFTCVDNGKWIFHASWWVPSTNNQNTYVLLLNKYPAVGANEWSVQVGANNANVTYYPAGSLQGTTPTSIPIVKTNQWVDLCIMIDFTVPNGSVDVYWDGRLLVAGKPWKSEPTSLMRMAAVDIYGGNLGGDSWVDDLALVRNCPRTWWRDIPDNFSAFWPMSPGVRPAFGAAFSPNRGYDNSGIDRLFGSSFTGLPYGPCVNFKGDLLIRAQPIIPAAATDTLQIGWNFGTSFVYNSTLAAASSTAWTAQPPTNILLNLTNTPSSGTTLLQKVNADGYLDILSRWFSRFDYARLRLWNCRPWWRGFSWFPWDATSMIDPGANGTLTATFVGGSGGVAQDLGDAEGWRRMYADMPDLRGNNVRWCEFAYGGLNGNPNQLLARLWTLGNGSQIQLNADFSPAGSTSARVRLYNAAGVLVGEGDRPGILMALLLPAIAGQPITFQGSQFRCRYGLPDEYLMALLLPAQVVLNGTTYNNVKSIRVSAINPTVARGPIDTGVIDVDGIPSVSITDGCRTMFASCISALGGAITEATNNQIYLSNIGGTGQDGVSIDLGKANWWKLEFVPNPQAPDLPDGSGVTARAYGRHNGVWDSPVGQCNIAATPTGYAFTADYSSVTSPTVRVRLLNGNTVLADIPGHASSVGESDAMPLTCGKGTPIIIGPPCFWWEWPTPGLFRVNGGGTYNVTRVEILAEPPSGTTVGPYQRVEFTGTTLEEMFITDFQAFREISGRIIPNDLAIGPNGQVMTVEIRLHGSTTPVETHQVVLGEDAEFNLTTAMIGDLDIAAKGSHWLRKTQRHSIDVDGLSGLVFSLPNGDCDDDNENGIGDYSVLSAGYNKCAGDPGWDDRSDLNGDGCTDIADYAILSANYGMVGDD